MPRRKVSAATKERRTHQKLRDLIWRKIGDDLRKVQHGTTTSSDLKHRDHVLTTTAIDLIRALRDTGAK